MSKQLSIYSKNDPAWHPDRHCAYQIITTDDLTSGNWVNRGRKNPCLSGSLAKTGAPGIARLELPLIGLLANNARRAGGG